MGVPRIMGTHAAKFDMSMNHQAYLVFIIALDSIHLNLYDDVPQRSGQCIPQACTGDSTAY